MIVEAFAGMLSLNDDPLPQKRLDALELPAEPCAVLAVPLTASRSL
jgi:hypothetical protein